ncbi:mitochondrial ribosomal protein L1 isoform X2 [Augochlora pura]
MSAGWLIKSLRSTYNYASACNASFSFIQTREYAARKGIRAMKQKLKVKKVVEKVGYVPGFKKASKLNKDVKQSPLKLINDSWRRKPVDNVWFVKYHPRPVYSFKDAIECHREVNHPTMYNRPNTYANAVFELNLQREKKNKYLEKFTNMVETPHPFEQEIGRTILAFCKKQSDNQDAIAAGADFAGGVELIKQIQNGNFPYKDYDYILGHVDILPDLLLIRGLLRLKFPNVKSGNLSNDIGFLVRKYKHGMIYKLQPDTNFKEYGTITCAFGTLDMDVEHLKENFDALIKNIYAGKPNRNERFIERVLIGTMSPSEFFKLQLDEFLPEQTVKKVTEDEEEDEVAIEDAVIASQ